MKERKVRWALETAALHLEDAEKTEDKDVAENCYVLAKVWLVEAKRRIQQD